MIIQIIYSYPIYVIILSIILGTTKYTKYFCLSTKIKVKNLLYEFKFTNNLNQSRIAGKELLAQF